MRCHPILLACAVSLATAAVTAQVKVRIKSKPRTWGARPDTEKNTRQRPQKRSTRASRQDAYRAAWAKDVQGLWTRLHRVSLDVDPQFKDNRFTWLKSGEASHNYKIVRLGGRIDYAQKPPTSDHDVKALFKRTSPGYEILEVGFNHQRTHAWVWIRMSFIAEDKKWIRGSGLDHRFRSDDKLYRSWFRRVVQGPDLKMSGCASLATSIVRDLSGVATTSQILDKLRSGRSNAKAIATRTASLKLKEKILAENRARLQQRLLTAGRALGVDDALWQCAERRFRIFTADQDRRMAEGEMRYFAARARKDESAAADFAHAKAKWQRLSRKVTRLRRDRRIAMQAVTKAVVALAAAAPQK